MAHTMSSKKVLVAVRPEDLPIVSDALGSAFDLIVCHNLADAQSHLGADIGLIACGVRFDSGRMFELLHAVKANPDTRSVPFYLILGVGKGYSQAILQGIKSAAEALGATGLTDLSRLENALGKEQAYQRLRDVIRQHLEG